MLLLRVLISALWFGAGAAAQENQAPFVLPPAPATTTPHVDFTSDHFDYKQSSGTIHLQGHVFMKESTFTVHADEIRLYLDERRAQAFGNVQMEDGTSLAFGDRGEYEFTNHSGSLENALAGFAPWRIDGATAAMNADRSLDFKNANFTSCNLYPQPHYHFHATSAHVRPHHHLYAWNAVFYLGKTPLFYTPFLWKSLDRDIIRTRVQPGYDRLNGQYVKTYTLYDYRYWHGKVFLDEYGHKGIGYGNEVDLYDPGMARGGLYGYRIREKHTGLERWAVLGDDFQVMPSSTAFQMRLQAQSDPNFNNEYNRTNSFAITPQLVNNAAIVHNNKLYTTRLSYSRTDQQDQLVTTRYDKTQEDYPRLDFQTASLTLARLPWLNTFNGFADNNFTAGRGFLQRSVQLGWQGKKSVNLFRGVSFVPTLGYNDTYESRFDDTINGPIPRTYLDSYIGRYTGGGDLRFNTWIGKWDAAETYTQRLTPDTANADSGAADHGVESNLLSLTHLLRPSRYVYTRVNTGYDWRVFRDHSVGFRDRVQPFSANATIAPTRNWSLLLNDVYQLNGGNQSIAVQSDWGRREGDFIGLGFNNTQSTATATATTSVYNFFVSQEFGILLSSNTLKINGILRENLQDARGGLHFNRLSLYDKELTIKKTWHDFITLLILRARPGGVKEAAFRIELKLDTHRPIGPSPKADTPWRTWKSDDDAGAR